MTGIAQEWLEGGYVGSPDYGEIRQYFTDPIFYTRVPVSQPLSFYRPYIYNAYDPMYAVQSEFRNRSLAAMQWEPFREELDIDHELCQGQIFLQSSRGGVWRSL